MLITDFEIGKIYAVKQKDFEPPDGSGVVPGPELRITVLAPATADNSAVLDGHQATLATSSEIELWRSYLRVKSESGRTHLLHPETIERAELVGIASA